MKGNVAAVVVVGKRLDCLQFVGTVAGLALSVPCTKDRKKYYSYFNIENDQQVLMIQQKIKKTLENLSCYSISHTSTY